MAERNNTPPRMTALGLLEQMRRANANREPEFNPIAAAARERRAAPSAPLFGGQRQPPLPIPPRPPAVIPPPPPQRAAPQAAAAPQARTPAQALPLPPRPPQLGVDGNPIPPAVLPQVPGAEPQPLHARFNPENPYVATATQMAERYGLPPNVFLSLVHQESRFRPGAVSRVGALGLGQLMPGTAREMGVDPNDPTQNLEGSARYLRSMLDLHKGDMPLALASYNAGPRRVQRAGNTIPNIPETQKYVPEVLRNAGVPGYAEGGLAHLEQKYAEGGRVRRVIGAVRRAVTPEPEAARIPPEPTRSVFPAPQRFFDPGDRAYKSSLQNFEYEPGGRYLEMRRGETPRDITGESVDNARISVGPDGRPSMMVGEPTDLPTGSPGRGSTATKTNLFKRSAGWKWTDAPEGYADIPTLVSVENRNQHYYALSADYPRGVDLSRYPASKQEPRLRPTTQGNVYPGNQVGTISVRGREHPVYDNVTVRQMAPAGMIGAAAASGEDDAPASLEHLEQKYSEGGSVTSLPTYDIDVRATRIPRRRASRPAPREELTADQLNGMVLDILARRAAAEPEAGAAAEARERIGRTMGYAEGGLADLHQKYESGGRVKRTVGALRRAVRGAAPEEIAENPRAVIGGNNPPSDRRRSAMTPDEAMAIATRPQPGAGVPRLEGDDLERANELSQRVLDFRAAQMRLPVDARVQPRPEDQLFPAARFDQPLEAGPSNVAQELESLRIQNISPTQSLPGSRAAAGLASDLAERYGTTMDRIVGDLDPIARIMRGEEVPGATASQIASARAGEFYNMRPVYDVLRGQGVSHDEALRRIRQESQAIAGTSPRTDTEQNVLNSAFLQNRMARGLPVDASTVENVTGPGSGYGMIYDQHPALTQGLLEGTVSLAQNPKPTVFGRNISGDRSAVTADVHNVRAVNMIYNDVNPGGLPASSFDTAAKYREYVAAYTPDADGVVRGMSDDELREILVARPSGQKVRGQSISTEYPIYNDITTNIAERLGLTPADAQALMWFHYGPRTGLASEAHTVPELLNQRMSITSQALGIPPEEVLRLYTRNMIPLAGVAPAAIIARGGEAAPSLEELDQRYAEGGRVISDEEYDRRLLERMKRDTGRTTESTNAEQAAALRSAGYDAAQLASDILLPQSPLDAALMVALGPGGRMARLAGSTALMAMEPSEAEAGGLRRLIRAYHGTPYRFDEFDPRKIGTGEGAQAFGRGLYFAEDEGVAKGYRDTLSRDTFLTPEGAVWSPRSLQHLNVRAVATRNPVEDLESAIRRGEGLLDSATPETRNLLESDLNVLNALRDAGGVTRNPGHMYEVNLNASPRDFLNWDRSLSQQPPEIQESLARLYPSMYRRGSDDYDPSESGQMIYRRLQSNLGDVETPNALMRVGIPGTRYFDAGSRGVGGGTSNYAVFDPEIIDITRRYAQGGLAQLEHKYAEGGAVSAQPAIYDPDAVNALANQIEADYV